MTESKGDIEKLFQESFDSFEADVDPSIWNNIADKIGSSAAPTDPSSVGSTSSSVSSSAGVSAGITVVKVALIATAAGLLSFAAYNLLSTNEVKNENSQVISTSPEVQPELEKVPENGGISPEIPSEENSSVEDKEVYPTENVEPKVASNNSQNEIETQSTPNREKSKIKTQVDSDEKKDIPVDKAHNKGASTKSIVTPPAKKEPSKEETNNHSDEELSPEELISQKDIFEAEIYASVKNGKQPLEVNFENRGTYAEQITWIFRDGGSTNGQSAHHIFDKSGSHWVVLEIRNVNGQISRDSMEINVEGKAYLNIPNIFTPNGDGYNDAFMVETEYISEFRCRILDRNNNLICEWNTIYGHWDGRDNNNNLVQEGPYFYIIEAVDMDGQALKPKKGVVTLSR